MSKKIFVILMLSLPIAFLYIKFFNAYPDSGSPGKKDNRILVSASFYPMYFFAREIGGDKAEVKNITPSGIEPHEYEPTMQDIASIENSDILILNGSLESWGNKIRNNLKGSEVKIIITGNGLIPSGPSGINNSADPHIWLSFEMAKKEAAEIAEAYISKDPANENYYRTNLSLLNDKMNMLDNEFRKQLSSCELKEFITPHAAFGYLASAYGLTQVSITGLSPDSEPSAQKLAEIVDFARSRKIRHIFTESLLNPGLSETIAGEIGAETLPLNPLEGLTDEEIKRGENYFSVMEKNLKNLKTALSCKN